MGNEVKVEERKPLRSHQLRLTMVGPYRISTVNIDALPGMALVETRGLRLGYETMVFMGNSNEDLDGEKYKTEDQARAGHDAMVAKWLLKVMP